LESPNTLSFEYLIENEPITFDLRKSFSKHPMCHVTYQEVNLEPSDMMRSPNGFIWKDLKNPGRYSIKTASYEYTGSASMTIRQYIKGELAAETKV
jgi:hypothetical protein